MHQRHRPPLVGDSSGADASGFSLDSDTVVHRRCNPLGTAEITLGGLHGHMPKEKLNLLQFAAGGAAKPSASSTEIVRREFANANLRGELLDDVPDQLFRHSFAPNFAGAAHTPKETTGLDSSRRRPVIQKACHPVGNGDGSNGASFPAEVHNCPMPFALLRMPNCQHRQLVPPQAAREQECKKCPITFTLHLPGVGGLPQSLPLLGG